MSAPAGRRRAAHVTRPRGASTELLRSLVPCGYPGTDPEVLIGSPKVPGPYGPNGPRYPKGSQGPRGCGGGLIIYVPPPPPPPPGPIFKIFAPFFFFFPKKKIFYFQHFYLFFVFGAPSLQLSTLLSLFL